MKMGIGYSSFEAQPQTNRRDVPGAAMLKSRGVAWLGMALGSCAQATATEAVKVVGGTGWVARGGGCLSWAHPKVCVCVCVCVRRQLPADITAAALPFHTVAEGNFPMRKPVPSQTGRML